MSWEYEAIFDREINGQWLPWESEPTQVPLGSMGYRTKTTRAGKRLEAEIYPIFGKRGAAQARAAKENVTSEAMRRLNLERSRRYIVQLADANFTEEDISLTLTYAGDPPPYEQCQKDIRNFLGRVKRARKKAGLPDLKYIYTIEDYQEGKTKRIHTHMLMSGGLDRDLLEKMWRNGYANADRLRPDQNGLEAIARYMTKQQKNRKKWVASKNLKKPKVRVSDTKASRGRVKRMAMGFENEAKEVMEKIYPGYDYVSSKVFWSDVIDGVYIRAVMRRRD